jgi:hypothetical protein
MPFSELSDEEIYERFVREHQMRAEAGDILSVQTLCYLALFADGWAVGDDLPEASRLLVH